MKTTVTIFWNGEDFIQYGRDSAGVFEQVVDFSQYDKIANGFKWSISSKKGTQRKYRHNSCMTISIYAMLDSIRTELRQNAKVICQTPDVELHFRAI